MHRTMNPDTATPPHSNTTRAHAYASTCTPPPAPPRQAGHLHVLHAAHGGHGPRDAGGRCGRAALRARPGPVQGAHRARAQRCTPAGAPSNRVVHNTCLHMAGPRSCQALPAPSHPCPAPHAHPPSSLPCPALLLLLSPFPRVAQRMWLPAATLGTLSSRLPRGSAAPTACCWWTTTPSRRCRVRLQGGGGSTGTGWGRNGVIVCEYVCVGG